MVLHSCASCTASWPASCKAKLAANTYLYELVQKCSWTLPQTDRRQTWHLCNWWPLFNPHESKSKTQQFPLLKNKKRKPIGVVSLVGIYLSTSARHSGVVANSFISAFGVICFQILGRLEFLAVSKPTTAKYHRMCPNRTTPHARSASHLRNLFEVGLSSIICRKMFKNIEFSFFSYEPGQLLST